MNILVKGALDQMTGYGNDVVGLVRSLADVGLDVHVKPVAVTPPIDPVVAQTLTKYPDMPYDIGLVYLEPSGISCSDMNRVCRRNIGWTMWEYETYREELDEGPPLSNRLADFDLVLFTDDTSVASLSPFAEAAGVAWKKLPGGYRAELWPVVRGRDWNASTFRFGMLGRLDRRKGPWLAIGAFMALKAEHGDDFAAELHLKTVLPFDSPVPHPDIHVLREWWPHARIAEFYANMHCLLAPSTGEGKNVPCLEAMSTGCPVIATNYAGHTEWLGPEWSYPLDYEAFEYPQGVAAKPSISHLAKLMWEVYTDRGQAKRKGEMAARIVPAMCDWKQVVHRLLAMPEVTG